MIGRLGGAFGLPEDGVAISWRYREKPQPPGAKFKIPPVDAPNVNGARDLGFPVKALGNGRGGHRRRSAPTSKRDEVQALYVFDPGPGRIIGDVSWVIAARRSRDAAAAHRAGRADDRRWRRRPTSCCRARRGSRRTAPT